MGTVETPPNVGWRVAYLRGIYVYKCESFPTLEEAQRHLTLARGVGKHCRLEKSGDFGVTWWECRDDGRRDWRF